MTERVHQLERMSHDAGFNVRAFADVDRMIWEKFLCNVTLSAPTAAFDVTVGELMANAETWAVALGCMMEAYRLGVARGVTFSFDDPVRYVTDFASTIPDASPSMRLDHLARRRSDDRRHQRAGGHPQPRSRARDALQRLAVARWCVLAETRFPETPTRPNAAS